MTLNRIASILGAVVLGTVLVGSTYGAPAQAHPRAHQQVFPYSPPVVHPYGPNGMRLGLHCDTKDMS